MDIDVIYNEDCFETFKRIEDKSIDMILCDLPYGTTACKWDTRIPLESLWEEYKRIIKKNGAIVLTASQPFTSILVMSNLEWFKYELIWEKTHPTGFASCHFCPLKYHENILVFAAGAITYNPQMIKGEPNHSMGKIINGGKIESNSYIHIKAVQSQQSDNKYPRSIQRFSNPRSKGMHPTQKPIALFEYLIKTYTNEGDLVLDNCIGSGTTAIACINTNRNYIGCELDKGYYGICIKRIGEYNEKRIER